MLLYGHRKKRRAPSTRWDGRETPGQNAVEMPRKTFHAVQSLPRVGATSLLQRCPPEHLLKLPTYTSTNFAQMLSAPSFAQRSRSAISGPVAVKILETQLLYKV